MEVYTDATVWEAIHTVRKSRSSKRVKVYSKARGAAADHEMAIVLQRLIWADISGVLFTADPVTGSYANMTGNFVYGLGEKLVSGEANPCTFSMERPNGKYSGPSDLKKIARKLYKIALAIERDTAGPRILNGPWPITGFSCSNPGRLRLYMKRTL